VSNKKTDDKDLPIGRLAKTVVNSLIGVHGLRRAVEIGTRIHEQLLAEMDSQLRRHPEEWDEKNRVGVLERDRNKRALEEIAGLRQTETHRATALAKAALELDGIPVVPEIPAVPIV